MYPINVLNDAAYRNQVMQGMKVADRYISPAYLSKYYITKNSSTIEDSYGDVRSPEIICITDGPEETYEALIFTYSRKNMDFSIVDRITVVTENGEKYLLPSRPPERVMPEASRIY